MKRVDYINQEPVMCFFTPILDLNKINNNKVDFSAGDFVHFNNNSTVPLSTFFYKYKKNLLIIDIDREKPIIHIIKNSKVKMTLNFENLSIIDFNEIDQIIDIYGKELKIKSFNDLNYFYNDFKNYKKIKRELYNNARLKFDNITKISNKMKELDKVAGTKKVIDFINNENIITIKNKLPNLTDNNISCIVKYRQSLSKLNALNIFISIYNILNKEFYDDFKLKSKEYSDLLSKANIEACNLNDEFKQKWFIMDTYVEEKNLGALYDCLNEMLCSTKYKEYEINFMESIICKTINDNPNLLDSFIEWVDLCPVDKQDLRIALNEIIKSDEIKKNNFNEL